MKNSKLLFLFVLAYFGLGFVNILFSLLALLCMGFPLFFLFTRKKKFWCHGYCPRSSLLTTVGKFKRSKGKKTPQSFIRGRVSQGVLLYFCANMFALIVTTTLVGLERVPPLLNLRFLVFITLPELIQLVQVTAPGWLFHLGYGFYSMMMTTTVVGLLLGVIYKPKTWCVICPIATVSKLYIDSTKGVAKA